MSWGNPFKSAWNSATDVAKEKAAQIATGAKQVGALIVKSAETAGDKVAAAVQWATERVTAAQQTGGQVAKAAQQKASAAVSQAQKTAAAAASKVSRGFNNLKKTFDQLNAKTPVAACPMPDNFQTQVNSARNSGKLEIPNEINDDFQKLWDKSLVDGTAQEHGGVFVLNGNGYLALVNQASGTSGTFSPQRMVAHGEQVIGTFHTHPYEDGSTGIAFSGADIAYTLNNKDKLAIVQSGKQQFAILRTDKTTSELVDHKGLNDEVNRKISDKVKSGTPFDRASEEVNKEIAERYGLMFLKGRTGSLKELK